MAEERDDEQFGQNQEERGQQPAGQQNQQQPAGQQGEFGQKQSQQAGGLGSQQSMSS